MAETEGNIVYRPPALEPNHECRPPSNLEPPSRPNPSITHPSGHPAGTVWQCDCDRTWVSDGGTWRREGRLTRWMREHSRDGLRVRAQPQRLRHGTDPGDPIGDGE